MQSSYPDGVSILLQQISQCLSQLKNLILYKEITEAMSLNIFGRRYPILKHKKNLRRKSSLLSLIRLISTLVSAI